MANAANLIPTLTFKSWLSNGQPNAGGTLTSYSAGTTTPIATWTDWTATVPNTNPITLNSRGEANIYLLPNVSYKFVEADSNGNSIKTTDQVINSFLNIYGGVDIGSPNSYILNFTSNFNTLTNGIVIYWIASNTNTGASTLNVNGLGAVPITNPDGSALGAGEILAGATTGVMYYNGAFQLIESGTLANPRTAAEIAAGVLPVSYQYPAGYVDRYGVNTTPGTTPMTSAFQAAINQARFNGVEIQWGPGPYALTAPLDCTFSPTAKQFGLVFRQHAGYATNSPPPTGSFELGALWVQHNGYAVFDLTGCSTFTFYDLTLVTSTPVGSYPKVCFLTARHSGGESNFPRFYNTFVSGYFTVAVFYNYGSEDGIYYGNYWGNNASDAGCNCVVITANNLYKGTSNFMSSAFVTIATGPQSCIGHTFIGGDYAVGVNASATSDTFYLEGGVTRLRALEFWIANNNNNGSTHGRSCFYNDTANGGASEIQIRGLHVENASTQPSCFIQIGAGTGSCSTWSVSDCYMNSNTHDIQIDASILMSGLNVQGLVAPNGLKGLSALGTVTDSIILWQAVMTIGTSQRNFLRISSLANTTVSTRVNDIWFDASTGSIYSSNGLGLFGSQTVTSQVTGWGTPTGQSIISNFPGASATLVQTSGVVAELITVLKSMGIFGA